jgi:hypothetical protein
MAKASSFENDIDKARMVLEDAIKGVEATDATLKDHSKGDAKLDAVNLPVEEAMVRESITLLERWKGQAATLVRSLDVATAAEQLQFERLFDENAGREKSGFLGRRIHRGPASPQSISSDIRLLLSASASLDALLQSARPFVVMHNRGSEDHLLRIIERRQRADFDIEEAQRRMDALAPRIADRKSRIGSARNAAALANFEEDLRALVAEDEMQRERERSRLPERETLQRLITIYEEFVEALNTQVAALNVMVGKLSLDIEQRVALLKAVEAQQAEDARHATTPAVEALIAAFEANVLAGYNLAERKAKTDAAFARRLEPEPTPAEAPAEEAEPEEAVAPEA